LLASVTRSTSRTNTAKANPAETGDAFAQILDRQFAGPADAATTGGAADPRERSDASDGADDRRPEVLERRDSKSMTTASSKAEATSAKPAPKATQPEKTAS